jgi:hypothetical protein
MEYKVWWVLSQSTGGISFKSFPWSNMTAFWYGKSGPSTRQKPRFHGSALGMSDAPIPQEPLSSHFSSSWPSSSAPLHHRQGIENTWKPKKSLFFTQNLQISWLVLWLISNHKVARQFPESILLPSSLNLGTRFVLCVCMCFKAVLWHIVRNSGTGPL